LTRDAIKTLGTIAQVSALVLIFFGMWVHLEERVARIEQHLTDQDHQLEEMKQQLTRIESRLQ